MPIYEYTCPKCKSEFELKLPLSESAKIVNCPKCQVPSRRLFSSFGCKTGGNLQASEKAFRKSARR